MKRVILTLLLATASTPVLAQHAGHDMGNMPMPAPAQSRPQTSNQHTGHTSSARPAPRANSHAGHAAPAAQPRPANPHAGHTMPAQSAPAADPHAGHVMPAPTAPAADPHAGHQMPAAQQPADPHAGHDMSGMDMGAMDMNASEDAPPVAPPPPEAMSGPAHAAETIYDPAAIRSAREALRVEHGGMPTHRFSIDRLEYAGRRGADGFAWDDVQFWYGGDLNKLWLKSQGEGTFGEGVERAEVQALYSRAIAPFWDVQLGVRHDFEPHPTRNHLVLGIQGLAPYWFEVDAAAFLSDHGDITARTEVEYDQRITQRLILQPRVEANFSLQDVPELNLGSGVTSAEAGLRLRYEIVPEFAPYVGVNYERALGGTADFRRAAGEDVGGWNFVLGVRAWF